LTIIKGFLLASLLVASAQSARHSDGTAGTVLTAAAGWSPLAGLTEFTISLWFRPDTSEQTPAVILYSRASDGTSEHDIDHSFCGGKNRICFGAIGVATNGPTFVPGFYWQHLALRRKKDGSVDAFVGGAKDAFNGPTPMVPIGREDTFSLFSAVGTCCQWNGSLADVFFSRRALSDGELDAIASAHRPVVDSATRAYWALDGYSAIEPDLSGGGHDLVAAGAGFAAVDGPNFTGALQGIQGVRGPMGPMGIVDFSNAISVTQPLYASWIDPDAAGNYALGTPGHLFGVVGITAAGVPLLPADYALVDNLVTPKAGTGRIYAIWTGK
jgi:hypothetical protein